MTKVVPAWELLTFWTLLEDLTRRLVQVPKTEIEKQRKRSLRQAGRRVGAQAEVDHRGLGSSLCTTLLGWQVLSV